MKRYITFIGDEYYPMGGMLDFSGDFETIEEAKAFIEEKVDKEKIYDTVEEQWENVWAHIWDTETMSKVWDK